MKFILPLYLLTCLGPAFLVSFSCRGSATELPVKYIFELSDEPVKVHPGKIDTKSVFFPKYARGTSPETLKRQAALFQSHSPHEASKSKPAISIHMLPEITANVFTPLCIIILLFILDWRMALACMIVIPIGVLLLMGQMKDYKNRSDRYIEASSNMDSSLVEYVNGIEVIKTFTQTGKSFQKFSDSVKNYHDTTLDWWKNNVPKYVGIMVVNTVSRFHFVAKRPVFQQITEERKDVLKKSLLRTLFYQKVRICKTKEELGSGSTEMEV